MSGLSVVIVTKNRSFDLSQCIGSLISNSDLPKEIIVVDNNSNDDTKQLAMGLGPKVKTKVKYISSKLVGFPKIYNRGLKEASGDWVAFIDDDCVADINWVDEILKSIKKYPKHAAIIGWCETYYSKNVFSQATVMFDNDWKQRSLDGKKVVDLEVLDTKNIVFNNNFIRKNKLEFDENRSGYLMGAAQDCDFGIQIQEVIGLAICNKKIKVKHKDPQDWSSFVKKSYLSWKSYDSLNLKWDMVGRRKLKSKHISLKELVNDFGEEFALNWFQKLKLFIVAKQVLLINKFLFVYFSFKKVVNE